eukprot:scaffold171319_cov19-Tisochrysis_lutea.AAC.2
MNKNAHAGGQHVNHNSMLALAEDHLNDVVSNICAIGTAAIASEEACMYIDTYICMPFYMLEAMINTKRHHEHIKLLLYTEISPRREYVTVLQRRRSL